MKGKGTSLAIKDISERVYAHLLAQQCCSEDADGEPHYYGLNDCRCDIDILIDDMSYCSAIECLGVSLLRVPREDPSACVLCRLGVNVDDDQAVDLLIDLQDIRDLTAIENWPAALEDIDRWLPRQLSC